MYMRVTRLIHRCAMTQSFICVTWLMLMRDTTHSYLWHDSCICVTWLIHMCAMTHSYAWYDSFVRHGSFVWRTRRKFICVTWLTDTLKVTRHMEEGVQKEQQKRTRCTCHPCVYMTQLPTKWHTAYGKGMFRKNNGNVRGAIVIRMCTLLHSIVNHMCIWLNYNCYPYAYMTQSYRYPHVYMTQLFSSMCVYDSTIRKRTWDTFFS